MEVANFCAARDILIDQDGSTHDSVQCVDVRFNHPVLNKGTYDSQVCLKKIQFLTNALM